VQGCQVIRCLEAAAAAWKLLLHPGLQRGDDIKKGR